MIVFCKSSVAIEQVSYKVFVLLTTQLSIVRFTTPEFSVILAFSISVISGEMFFVL
jgi:hypothetical protein